MTDEKVRWGESKALIDVMEMAGRRKREREEERGYALEGKKAKESK